MHLSPSEVRFNRDCTVAEFLEELFDRHPHDWGYISVNAYSGHIERVKYDCGKLESPLSVPINESTIERATASGGYSRMDYHITVNNKKMEENRTAKESDKHNEVESGDLVETKSGLRGYVASICNYGTHVVYFIETGRPIKFPARREWIKIIKKGYIKF